MATRPVHDIDPLEGWSLPSWTYHDAEFHQVELDRVFRPSWQVVCHTSDIPQAGDWHTLDYCGESVIVVRGADDVLRAFTNVCRHRDSRLVDGASGCAKKLRSSRRASQSVISSCARRSPVRSSIAVSTSVPTWRREPR